MLLIKLGEINNFFRWEFLGMLVLELRTAGSGSKYASHCAIQKITKQEANKKQQNALAYWYRQIVK